LERGRLPTWVVRILSLLIFIIPLPIMRRSEYSATDEPPDRIPSFRLPKLSRRS
jgi:hypothetical protein